MRLFLYPLLVFIVGTFALTFVTTSSSPITTVLETPPNKLEQKHKFAQVEEAHINAIERSKQIVHPNPIR